MVTIAVEVTPADSALVLTKTWIVPVACGEIGPVPLTLSQEWLLLAVQLSGRLPQLASEISPCAGMPCSILPRSMLCTLHNLELGWRICTAMLTCASPPFEWIFNVAL